MGQYDRAMKLLVESNPEAMARFVLHEWRKQQKADIPETPIKIVTLLSEEFQSEELKGDAVWLVEGPEGPLYMIEVEYQSALDPTMPLRSLEYLARAKKRHIKTCGHLPVIAVVMYLFDDEQMPDCPLRWPGLNGTTALLFQYLIIQMKDIPREEFLSLGEASLWPLALLTKGRVDRILVEEMFTDLLNQKLYQTLPIGYMIAAWFLRGADLKWLKKEFQKMHEIFTDSPAIQWIEDAARADERKRAQLQLEEVEKRLSIIQRQAERQLRAEQKKAERLAEQRLRMEQKKAEKQLHAEQKKAEAQLLATLRQMLIELVAARFPSLGRLAKAQARVTHTSARLQQAILRISQVQQVEEAQNVLLSLADEDEDEVAARLLKQVEN